MRRENRTGPEAKTKELTPAQRRAQHRIHWLEVIIETATAGNYHEASDKERESIKQAAAKLALMIRYAARLPDVS